jgi:hypothetical protein
MYYFSISFGKDHFTECNWELVHLVGFFYKNISCIYTNTVFQYPGGFFRNIYYEQ